jgi:ClpP class serine protease
MRGNAMVLKEERDQERRGSYCKKEEGDEEKDFEQGVNNIRQKMYSTVKENRNLKQYKKEEYEQEC